MELLDNINKNIMTETNEIKAIKHNKKPSVWAKVLGSIIVFIILLILGSPFIALGMFLQWYFFS